MFTQSTLINSRAKHLDAPARSQLDEAMPAVRQDVRQVLRSFTARRADEVTRYPGSWGSSHCPLQFVGIPRNAQLPSRPVHMVRGVEMHALKPTQSTTPTSEGLGHQPFVHYVRHVRSAHHGLEWWRGFPHIPHRAQWKYHWLLRRCLRKRWHIGRMRWRGRRHRRSWRRLSRSVG